MSSVDSPDAPNAGSMNGNRAPPGFGPGSSTGGSPGGSVVPPLLDPDPPPHAKSMHAPRRTLVVRIISLRIACGSARPGGSEPSFAIARLRSMILDGVEVASHVLRRAP
jgi:hypothetical protein